MPCRPEPPVITGRPPPPGCYSTSLQPGVTDPSPFFGSQPLLPSQFLGPATDFLTGFPGLLKGHHARLTSHKNVPGPVSLPDELFPACDVLVRRDASLPPLTHIYDGSDLVLEQSLCSFKLQLGNWEYTIRTLRLNPCPLSLAARHAGDDYTLLWQWFYWNQHWSRTKPWRAKQSLAPIYTVHQQ
jgi:hypothetical protein